MKQKVWIRFLALFLLLAMVIGGIPGAMATEESSVEKSALESVSEEPTETVEPEPTPEPTPTQQLQELPEEAQKGTEDPDEQEPTDMNGETLTRHAVSTGGPRRARSSAYGTVSKSTCVEFAGYTSPYWYCNRYDTLGSHVYGHYYYCEVIAYHGVSSAVLNKGVGHLPETSLPVGGESTHAVLAGHSGMSHARLFTDLPKLEIGDEFYIHVYGKKLCYKVDQVKKVRPWDTADLNIMEGQDYVTLLTCVPIAVNSHRLLVRGVRVA